MTYKKKPQKQTTYPGLLSTFEQKRKKGWLQNKQGIKENLSFKDRNSRRLQMFSGKRGK